MAKKSTPPTTDSTFARAPKGFRQLGSVTAECWFALKPGNVIQGKLLGVYKRKDTRVKSGESEFFQVVLSEPCECRYGRGEKVTFKTAPAGTTVNLNCNVKTAVLKDLMADMARGAQYDIHVSCNKKITLQNGNTMWDMMPSAHMTVAPEALEDPDFDGGDGQDEKDGAADDGQDAA